MYVVSSEAAHSTFLTWPGNKVDLRNIKSITFKVHIQLVLYYLCNGFKIQPPDLQTFSDTGFLMCDHKDNLTIYIHIFFLKKRIHEDMRKLRTLS